MATRQLLIRRHERKYRIPPSIIPRLREAIGKYCEADPACTRGPYLVSSLYLDSPNRGLYLHSQQRRPRRFKLRARRYVDGPLFLEIKWRDRLQIRKSRVAIDPGLWPGVMYDSRQVDAQQLAPEDCRRVHSFLDLGWRLHAQPSVVARYAREAYASRVDGYARVTFDYHLQGLRPDGYDVPIEDAAPWLPFDDRERFGLPFSSVILELKCTTAVPQRRGDGLSGLSYAA